MISKELLSAVLGGDGDVYLGDTKWGSSTVYTLWKENPLTPVGEINIHELAHKCKEWALKQNYDDNIFTLITYEDMSAKAIITSNGFGFIEDTEPEAIFKACQWILDNKDG